MSRHEIGAAIRASIGATIGTAGARAAGRASGAILTRIQTDEKELFLTIDDGPSTLSRQVAEYLQSQHISATWFLVGERADRNREAVEGILVAGHTIGNHSYRHLDAWRSRWPSVERDLDAGLAALERLVDGRCHWTRPPYGRFTPETVRWCATHDQQLVLWDVLAPDFSAAARPPEVASRVRAAVRCGSIVALHDRGNSKHFDSLRQTVDSLLIDGWAFRGLPTTA